MVQYEEHQPMAMWPLVVGGSTLVTLGLMRARGLSTGGQAADGTECLDCIQTHGDQARAVIERDERMEAEFAKSEAARLASGGNNK